MLLLQRMAAWEENIYRGRGLQTENDQINIGEELAKTEAGHVISCHVTLIRMGCHRFFLLIK